MKTETLLNLLTTKLTPVGFNRINQADDDNKKKLAAVIVPIILHPNHSSILLTQRTKHLKNHPGQICFPGGCYEQQDSTLPATALRETFEEIGVDEKEIKLIGELSPIKTISGNGFRVTPYIGLIKPPLMVKINDEEVDDIFEVPVKYLLELTHYKKEQIIYNKKSHSYYVIHYQNRIIWGATATILHQFALLLRR